MRTQQYTSMFPICELARHFPGRVTWSLRRLLLNIKSAGRSFFPWHRSPHTHKLGQLPDGVYLKLTLGFLGFHHEESHRTSASCLFAFAAAPSSLLKTPSKETEAFGHSQKGLYQQFCSWTSELDIPKCYPALIWQLYWGIWTTRKKLRDHTLWYSQNTYCPTQS